MVSWWDLFLGAEVTQVAVHSGHQAAYFFEAGRAATALVDTGCELQSLVNKRFAAAWELPLVFLLQSKCTVIGEVVTSLQQAAIQTLTSLGVWSILFWISQGLTSLGWVFSDSVHHTSCWRMGKGGGQRA